VSGGADDRREEEKSDNARQPRPTEQPLGQAGGTIHSGQVYEADSGQPGLSELGADNQSENAFPEMVGADEELLAMLKAGVHFGHRKSRVNARMLPYIFGVRNNVHIIDLVRTKANLHSALEDLKELRSQGKTILFVGTRPTAKPLIKELASALDMPYVINRWVGGTLTNFAVIAKRLEYFRDLETKQKRGDLEKYTKHEQHLFQIELRRLEEKFGGIKQMQQLPNALFLADLYEDELAAREGRRLGIPVIAIADTNTDPTLADGPIPGNDDALSSLQYILGRVREALMGIIPEPQV
jgi:small subunit ribosomal protein S2